MLQVPMIQASTPADGQQIWEPPFDEFRLQRIDHIQGTEAVDLPPGAPSVVLAVSGTSILSSRHGTLQLERGDSAFVTADEHPATLGPAGKNGAAFTAFTVTTAAKVTAMER